MHRHHGSVMRATLRSLAAPTAALVLVATPACGRKGSTTAAPPASAPSTSTLAAPGSPPAPQAPPVWSGFRPEDGPITTGRAMSYASLSATEQKFGVAPSPSRGNDVVYQDHVVLIEHGDKVVKSVASDGMSWTLDATDPRVAALEEGDVVFATTDCVGQILKLSRAGDEISLVLGPAQLTDIIKKGNFEYDAPLDLDAMTAVEDPDFPGTFGSAYFDQMKQEQTRGSGSAGPASPLVIENASYYVVSPQGAWRPMRTVRRSGAVVPPSVDGRIGPSALSTFYVPQAPDRSFNNVLSATPCYTGCGGLGVRLSANRAGLKIDIFVVLRLTAPRFSFALHLDGLTPRAHIELTGGAGFLMTIQGTTDPAFTSNLNETGAVPVDLTLPLQFGAVPLVLHYHQDVSLATAFSARTSVLQAREDLRVTGRLGFDFDGAKFTPLPLGAEFNKDPSHDVNGISMGINSIVAGISQRLLMGLGRGSLAVGPYVSLTTSATALKQATEASHLMLAQPSTGDCTQATLVMQVYGGIGYALPKAIVSVVNFFLKIIHVKPISETGSLFKFLQPFNVVNQRFQLPDGCAGK